MLTSYHKQTLTYPVTKSWTTQLSGSNINQPDLCHMLVNIRGEGENQKEERIQDEGIQKRESGNNSNRDISFLTLQNSQLCSYWWNNIVQQQRTVGVFMHANITRIVQLEPLTWPALLSRFQYGLKQKHF